jgi:hypothetical protein
MNVVRTDRKTDSETIMTLEQAAWEIARKQSNSPADSVDEIANELVGGDKVATLWHVYMRTLKDRPKVVCRPSTKHINFTTWKDR